MVVILYSVRKNLPLNFSVLNTYGNFLIHAFVHEEISIISLKLTDFVKSASKERSAMVFSLFCCIVDLKGSLVLFKEKKPPRREIRHYRANNRFQQKDNVQINCLQSFFSQTHLKCKELLSLSIANSCVRFKWTSSPHRAGFRSSLRTSSSLFFEFRRSQRSVFCNSTKSLAQFIVSN